MQVNTGKLIGAALDWAVAKAAGHVDDFDSWLDSPTLQEVKDSGFRPSTDWSQGGPLIERERIKVFPNVGGNWLAQIKHEELHPLTGTNIVSGWTNTHGSTPLVAAMRCYVASTLGYKIEVPDALVEMTV